MTITKTLKKFEELKEAILKDGKVDYAEAEVLLDFIDDYARAGNKNFIALFKTLMKAKIDGKITKEESDKIMSEINNASEFLKKEKKIEVFLSWFVCGLIAFGILACIFR